MDPSFQGGMMRPVERFIPHIILGRVFMSQILIDTVEKRIPKKPRLFLPLSARIA